MKASFLLCRLALGNTDGDARYVPGEFRIVDILEDLIGYLSCLVPADISSFICRVNPWLSFLDPTLSNLFTVHIKGSQTAFAGAAAIVIKLQLDLCVRLLDGLGRSYRIPLQSKSVVGIGWLATVHIQRL